MDISFKVWEAPSKMFMPCIEVDGEPEVWKDGTLLEDKAQADQYALLLNDAYNLGRAHTLLEVNKLLTKLE